jgi:alanine racemase
MTTRRSFLQTSAVLATRFRANAADSSFDPWVEINADNLRHNVAEISRRAASRPVLAVIKNNGYGLGVVNAARLLEPLPAVHGFAVVKLHEAVQLRDANIRKPVLCMGPFDEQNLEEMVARRIMPMVYTPVGATLDRIAAKQQRPVPIHICVDTGIGRVGVPYRQAPELIADLGARSSTRIEGVMMTFTEDPEFDPVQLKRFEELKIMTGKRHAASSFGLFQHPEAFLDMVRPGMAVYGVYSESQFRKAGILNLRPAVALRARVAYVKQLREGDSAGYERAYKATGPVWIATVPAGHADGVPRQAAKGGHVRINGNLYPIVASISASHTIVEIGAERTVEIGDTATYFDWQDGSRPEDFGESCNSSVYDLTMHLGALLLRRVV